MKNAGRVATPIMALVIGALSGLFGDELGEEIIDMRDGIDYEIRDTSQPFDVIIHHTYTNGKGAREVIDEQKARGWPDGAYHVMVSWEGKKIPVNDIEEKTWGVAGRNSRSIHIAYLGNGHERFATLEALVAIKEVITAFREAGVQVRSIQPHCAYARKNPTACPGKNGVIQFAPLYENPDDSECLRKIGWKD